MATVKVRELEAATSSWDHPCAWRRRWRWRPAPLPPHIRDVHGLLRDPASAGQRRSCGRWHPIRRRGSPGRCNSSCPFGSRPPDAGAWSEYGKPDCQDSSSESHPMRLMCIPPLPFPCDGCSEHVPHGAAARVRPPNSSHTQTRSGGRPRTGRDVIGIVSRRGGVSTGS